MTGDDLTYDYVIAGGGTAGSVLASRLSQAGNSVALIEAGPENYSAQVMSPTGAPHLHDTDVSYNCMSEAQPHLAGRSIPNYGGKLLSGSSGVNYGLWTRGHSADYDDLARSVDDRRWSYERLLPYFRKCEDHFDLTADKNLHGFGGPIATQVGARKHPSREPIFNALISSGLKENSDANSGDPLGIGAFTENWKGGQRQPAAKAYDLAKVNIFTESVVARILLDRDSMEATGVVLVDGTQFHARKEVIIFCGAIKTPQLLMLSGIGPKDQLENHSITSIVDLPVGHNLHDHLAGVLFFKLKHPAEGLAIGSPAFNNPDYFTGNPMDWLATISIPETELAQAAEKDQLSMNHPMRVNPRAHAEIMFAYAPVSGKGSSYSLPIPFDGTHIAALIVMLLPTSRGRLELNSADPTVDPSIDPNYYSTELDRTAMRAGFRAALRTFETVHGQAIVDEETPPQNHHRLTSQSEDLEFDERLKITASSFYQNACTVALGSVVDSECRVFGIKSLRVCDASILTLPIAAHYQAPLYAISEAVADMILDIDMKEMKELRSL